MRKRLFLCRTKLHRRTRKPQNKVDRNRACGQRQQETRRAFLQEQRRSFQEDVPITGDVLFADFMEQWLTVIKSSVAVTTFASYSNMVKKVIVPYFRERQIALQELSAKHIQDFYLKELERVSASSVIHYHANIHKALKYAVKLDLISSNPADKIERPKKERFMANFYDADEVNRLFEISKGTKLEIPILFGAFYGMRRSETLGMKWDAIDFERDTITIGIRLQPLPLMESVLRSQKIGRKISPA